MQSGALDFRCLSLPQNALKQETQETQEKTSQNE